MLCKVKNGIWFDNESLKIYLGDESQLPEENSRPEYVDISQKPENWKPTIIYLSATTCNLRCKYCYAHDGTYGVSDGKVQFDLNTYIETFIRVHDIYGGVSNISFFGGEPMINFKEIKKFVLFLYENYPKSEIPKFSINTNSTIISEEIIDFLKKYNFVVGTSIDGPKEIHDKNRISSCAQGTYDTVVKNIQSFSDFNINVLAQFTLSKQHMDLYEASSVCDWYGTLEKLPIRNYDIIPVSTEDIEYKINLGNENYIRYCEETADYYLRKMSDSDISKVPRMFIGLFLRILLKKIHTDCSAGYSLCITPNKEIYPCQSFVQDKRFKVSFEDFHSIADLENNEYFLMAKKSNRMKVEKCKDCISRKVCGAWCKGLTYSLKGSFDDVLEERCVMMRIYTRKIIEFIVEKYPKIRKEVSKKLTEYNKIQEKIGKSYES